MNVYKYDELTKEYTGVETAQLDPLESKLQGKEVYLLPANATFTAPLVTQDGYVPVWGGNAWEYKEDNRGKEYWLADDEYGTPAREMKELGAFPENAVFEAPAKPFEMLKEEKLVEVDAWTANKITGGFTSTASGEAVTYDSDKDTQLTMQGIALNVNTELFAEKYPTGCPVRGYGYIEGVDEEGNTISVPASEKSIFMLTPEQVMLWCADLSMHIGNCKQAGWMKQAEVAAATTKEELNAIILD